MTTPSSASGAGAEDSLGGRRRGPGLRSARRRCGGEFGSPQLDRVAAAAHLDGHRSAGHLLFLGEDRRRRLLEVGEVHLVLHRLGVVGAGEERFVLEGEAVERDRGGDTGDRELGERPPGAFDRLGRDPGPTPPAWR